MLDQSAEDRLAMGRAGYCHLLGLWVEDGSTKKMRLLREARLEEVHCWHVRDRVSIYAKGLHQRKVDVVTSAVMLRWRLAPRDA